MKTAAAIDAIARFVLFAAMVLLYQYFIVTYLEHRPEKAWAPQLWRHLERRWRERSAVRVPQAFQAIRLRKSIELPQEPPADPAP